MKKALQTAWYEAKMSSRGWRFWLLLFLIAGLSLFARRDYLFFVDSGLYLHSAFSFQHPSFWLMITIFGLGAVAQALDTCGRLRRNRMDKILFPLPFHSMELIWGRFFGVLLIMLPMSAAGLFSLGLWQYLYGHGYEIWQPFIAAYLLLVIPFLVPIAALAITLRTYFKHDFAALLIGAVLMGVCSTLNPHYGLFINPIEVTETLSNTSPTLGVFMAYSQYAGPLAVHLLLSVFILMLAPLYLRRQEPQRWVVARSRTYSLFAIPTLLRWLTNLKFDRHLGWRYRMSLVLLLVGCTGGVLWAAYRHQENLANPHLLKESSKESVNESMPPAVIEPVRYAIDVMPSQTYDRLEIKANLVFYPTEPTRQMGIELDPTFALDEVTMDGESLLFTQREEKVRVLFGSELPVGEEKRVEFLYHGVPEHFHPDYSALLSVWYPLPWRKIQTELGKQWIKQEYDLFEASVRLHLQPGQSGVFAGDLDQVDEREEKRVEHWNTFYPVHAMQLFWGRYSSVVRKRENYEIRFFHLPTHEYQSQVYLEEIEEQEEYVHEKLGELPFPRLTLVEVPYQQVESVHQILEERTPRRRWSQSFAPPRPTWEMMPGMLTVSENLLSYLHEGIWLLERLDHNPREIAFYQALNSVLDDVHGRFYDNLISTYFDHSLHPSGELAFWIEEHLSGYAQKLLIRNSWWRRRVMDFDLGTSPNLPLSIARRDSLFELQKHGKYPQLLQVRGEGTFRMIHHLLGDEKWWLLMKEVFKTYRFRELPSEEFLALVEVYYGDDLGWFYEQWIYGSVLPSYEITLAEAQPVENEERNRMDYQVMVRVKNHGTGRIPVPIYIETEMDQIFRDLLLDRGEEETLRITVPHRPVYAVVDPENWIVQEPFFNKEKQTRGHSEKRIFIQGDEQSSSLRQGDGRRRRRGRRHRW